MPKRRRNKRDSKEGMDRVKCGHCHTFLSKRQYHQHKRQFFDTKSGKWTTVEDFVTLDIQGSSSSDGMCISTCTVYIVCCTLYVVVKFSSCAILFALVQCTSASNNFIRTKRFTDIMNQGKNFAPVQRFCG